MRESVANFAHVDESRLRLTIMKALAPHPSVAIVGATGAVGREMLTILETRNFPVSSLRLFASSRSAGAKIPFRGEAHMVEPLRDSCAEGVDIALFSAGKSISRDWAAPFVASGAFVIDNSSCFRMDAGVPLLIPQVNPEALDGMRSRGIIAVPNCSTIIALVAVTPLHRALGVERMIVSTYQAASGAGAAAMQELEQQAHAFAAGKELATPIFGRPYLFNLFSHNSAIGEDGFNEEERKLLLETRKIWEAPSVRVAATCVRVPVLRAHAESIHLELARSTSEAEVRALLSRAPGVRIVDDRAANRFPEPRDATGGDDVLVGRIRMDPSVPDNRGVMLFVAGDQLRKGAALDAVEIAECLLERFGPRHAHASSLASAQLAP